MLSKRYPPKTNMTIKNPFEDVFPSVSMGVFQCHVSELRGVSLLSNIGYYIKGILAAPPKATPPVIRG